MLLPLFPLQLVVFPGEDLKLHIFEPRYKQLIRECESEGITFGIPAFVDGKLAEYGTEMTLAEVFRVYDEGEMDVLVQGIRPFHLTRFIREAPGKLYAAGEVECIENDPDALGAPLDELMDLYTRLHHLFQTDLNQHTFGQPNLSFRLAHEVGLTLEQKVGFLGIPREGDRLAALADHLRNVLPILEAAEHAKKHIRGNGHFKKLPRLDL